MIVNDNFSAHIGMLGRNTLIPEEFRPTGFFNLWLE